MIKKVLSSAAGLPRSPGAAPRPAAVSVVIPCYRQARFLAVAIESVLAQSFRDFEIVVVDDGSPDETAEIAESFPGVRLVRQANQGLSGARNSGLRESRASCVLFLDADDRLPPTALEAGIECLRAHPECGFVWGQYRMITAEGARIGKAPRGCPDDAGYAAFLRRNCVGMNARVLFRREALVEVGGFDPSLPACEDYDVYLKVARRFPVRCHDAVVAEYRWHTSNMSQDPARMLAASLRVLRRHGAAARSRPDWRDAYAEGCRTWRALYGAPLFERSAAGLRRSGSRARAFAGLFMLLRLDPGRLIREAAHRIVRHRASASRA